MTNLFFGLIFLFITSPISLKVSVVLGWIISLCVGPGIEPATFRFQSKVLITPLPSLRSSSTLPKPGIEPVTFRFQSKVLVTPLPSLRSSSTFLLSLSLSLSLSPFHSLCASSFVSLPPASASRREKVASFLCYYIEGTRPWSFGGGERSGHFVLYVLRGPS